MQLYLLHLDDALKSQPDFMETCASDSARHIDIATEGAQVRLWGKNAKLDEIKSKLSENFSKSSNDAKLCFMGSGDFHHITALILGSTIEKSDERITIIHFDNHPDWVNFEDGMHCGSWVNRAASYANVDKIITIGVCSKDLKLPELKGANLALLAEGKLELFPYNHKPSYVRKEYGSGASYNQKQNHLEWNTIEKMGEPAFLETLLSRINTKAVYITVDKDVLAREDAITNWDQGVMSLPYLLQIIKKIGENHKVIGADVTGDYSKPKYDGSILTRLSKRAEILMDQPQRCRDICSATSVNSASNHALLEIFSEIIK